jgi:transcription elongation factor Elf1
MNATLKLNDQPEAAVKPRGFGNLPCIHCGEEAVVSIDLNDFTGEEALRCNECEATYSLESVKGVMAKWAPVLAWLETAPVIEE